MGAVSDYYLIVNSEVYFALESLLLQSQVRESYKRLRAKLIDYYDSSVSYEGFTYFDYPTTCRILDYLTLQNYTVAREIKAGLDAAIASLANDSALETVCTTLDEVFVYYEQLTFLDLATDVPILNSSALLTYAGYIKVTKCNRRLIEDFLKHKLGIRLRPIKTETYTMQGVDIEDLPDLLDAIEEYQQRV